MKKKNTNVKKVTIILLIIISIISFSAIIYGAGTINNPTTITFADANLYDAIKKQFSVKKISYNGNDVEKTIEVSINDVEQITELDLSTSGISNLSGLENFRNLTSLNLSKNVVTAADPLQQLQSLQTLNMAENPINTEILTAISTLTNITQLDMSNTQMTGGQLEYFKNLTNLKSLKIASNNISAIEKLAGITGLTQLDISINTSFTDITQVSSFTNLVELNLSGTGITTFSGTDEKKGISALTNLERLYAADIKGITETKGITELFSLEKIKVLNLSSMGVQGSRPTFSFSSSGFAKLKNLEELHLASNEISSLSGINNLANLDYLDLKFNKIQDTNLKDIIKKANGEVVTENTLKASKIDLRGNQIAGIEIFADYPADIKWLDLSENQVVDVSPLEKHSFSEALYLQNQQIVFGLYQKAAKIDHYIFLPTIITYAKIPEKTFMYDESVEFEYNGVTLNPDYTNPDEYNVIISSDKTNNDILTVTVKGGVADGTVLKFQFGKQGNIKCLIESILYKDENLEKQVNDKLYEKLLKQSCPYWKNATKLTNLNRNAVDAVEVLDLQHTASTVETKIKDLTGLENFYKLPTLYLQNNDVNSIEQLASCTKLEILNLASNPNIGDDNSSIGQMGVLTTLNLSNTGMTNIDSINVLAQNTKNKLTILDISDNGLDDISGIENLRLLQSLAIANENLDDQDISKLAELTNLTTLNINGNQIQNLDVLSNLVQLKYLYFNNNKVKTIEPLRGKVFYELEFTGNEVVDISPLSSHRTINNLKMDNNKIDDVSILDRVSMSNEQNLSVTGQKIVKLLDNNSTGEVSIPLPQIFKAARTPGNKIYTNNDLITNKCSIDSSGNNILINTNELNGNVAQIEIYGGKATGTKLIISAPLETTITYEPSNKQITNQNVTATIIFNNNDRDIKITNNGGKNTYIFEQNGEFIFEFIDKYGVVGNATATVQNIDKQPPTATVEQQQNNKQVEVVISVNEKVADIEGWTSKEFADGTMTLTKIYTSDANENIILIDEAGNSSTVNIDVKIKVISDIITSDKLEISEEELLIRGINPKTSVSEITKDLKAEMKYIVVDKNERELSSTAKIGTGCKIKMENGKIYTIIVWGDLDGNGQISLIELAKIAKIGVNSITPNTLEKTAIDINTNGKIDLSELAAIAKLGVK